ncbi:MAG: hypothetical protein J6W84_06205 [Bacteroidales bacterium]|nr:hypothetical protein [Bacteroidales bacterium]
MSDQMTYTPPWWEKEITVYNRNEDKVSNIVVWYRYNIPNCFWAYEGNQLTIGSTVLETNTTICRIPQNKRFKERYVWESLNDKNNYFTLGTGDIIVLGNVTDLIDEYASGHRSTDLINKYKDLQGCIRIQSVANNTGTARCIPHYLVRGE